MRHIAPGPCPVTPDERLDRIDADLRENARVTGGLAETVRILRDDALRHADRETVDRLRAVQAVHGEDIAVLKHQMSDSNIRTPPPGDDRTGPSWTWLNPFEWWVRAGAENAPNALRVFRGLALLLLLGYLVVKGVGWTDRYVDAVVRASEAAKTEAEAAETEAAPILAPSAPEGQDP